MNNENEISVYGNSPNAMDDFPILKAFQQYIDAEQAKARRRLISISIIFSVLTISLVAAFMYLLNNANDRIRELGLRNQALNDRLVEFAMRERDRSVDMATGNAARENKAVSAQLTNALAAIQAKIDEQQTAIATLKTENEQRRAAEQKTATPPVSKEDPVRADALKDEMEKFRAATQALNQERRALDEEKERLRREEIERQRRRLYPEYYEKLDAATAPAATSDKPKATSNKPTAAVIPASKAQTTELSAPKALPKTKVQPVAATKRKPLADELEPRLKANEDLYEALDEIDEDEFEDEDEIDDIEDETLPSARTTVTKPSEPIVKSTKTPVGTMVGKPTTVTKPAAKTANKPDASIDDLKPVSYFDAEKAPSAKPAAKPAVKPAAKPAVNKQTVKPTAAKPVQKPAAKPKTDRPKTEEELLDEDINDVLNQLNIDVDVHDADDEKPATKWRVPVK